MMRKCNNCGQKEHCRDSFISWLFFLVGLIATVAIRIVMVLDAYHPIYGKIAWYIGVAGFFIFFVYKFKVDIARSRLIQKEQLADKLQNKASLEDKDYRLLSSILCSLSSRKDLINYLFIFVSSMLALLIAVYIDIFRR
ncbi:MAG: hypothetical protein WC561_02890 [Candidatus Omnitrophota bacterium]|jgi:uncharacterized protein YhhL (DUF1145 family)